jgi:circadian clock protein KaiB
MTRREKKATKKPGAASAEMQAPKYILHLYVTGTTPRSKRSILNIRSFCQKYLLGRYELEVIDIYQQPELAREAQLIAAPTLIKKLPLPLRKLVGDLSDKERVFAGLNVKLQVVQGHD